MHIHTIAYLVYTAFMVGSKTHTYTYIYKYTKYVCIESPELDFRFWKLVGFLQSSQMLNCASTR